MTTRARPYQPAEYVAVDFPYQATAELTARIVAWLAVNDIDADDVPQHKPLKISAGPLGNQVITYARVIRLPSGEPLKLRGGRSVATEPVTVPLVEPLPAALARYARPAVDPHYAREKR